MPDGPLLFLRVLLALVCVVALIWWIGKRAGAAGGRRRPEGPAVSVVGRQSLGRHAGVAVVAVGERRLLVGVSEHGVSMLTELDAVPEPEPEPVPEPVVVPAKVADRKPADRKPAGRKPADRTPKAATDFEAELDATLGAELDRELDAALDAIELDAGGLPVVPPAAAPPSALAGSVLSAETWRRAVAAVQQRTVRR